MSKFIANNKTIKNFFIGLGNPGMEYSKTRHNVGYMAIDKLIECWQATEKGSKKKLYNLYEASLDKQKVCLVKPITFMNLSGKAVQSILTSYKCKPSNFIVIYDDASLPFGKVRIRKQGSAGGHNGIKSIIEAIGSDFPRIKIGIGDNRDGSDLSNHVLGRFSKEEFSELGTLLEQVPEICKNIIEFGIEKAISSYSK
jgi:PTH1 family peptidyl-tRNA hydrolase